MSRSPITYSLKELQGKSEPNSVEVENAVVSYYGAFMGIAKEDAVQLEIKDFKNRQIQVLTELDINF